MNGVKQLIQDVYEEPKQEEVVLSKEEKPLYVELEQQEVTAQDGHIFQS